MKIGYVTAEFSEEFKKSIREWSLVIPKEEIVSVEINGKMEGGNVTNDLHLTLFYGFDDEKINKKELLKFLGEKALRELRIEGLRTFSVPQYKCNILYLKIDGKNMLEKIHDSLKKFPYFEKFQNNKFIPHLTIAYIKDSFDISLLKLPQKMNKVDIKELMYHSK
ncbi:MAG: 2'-5' RNA ligase family protein [Candidatus Paceibacterota bacterium]|jgi:2'-5' RNA ligase